MEQIMIGSASSGASLPFPKSARAGLLAARPRGTL